MEETKSQIDIQPLPETPVKRTATKKQNNHLKVARKSRTVRKQVEEHSKIVFNTVMKGMKENGEYSIQDALKKLYFDPTIQTPDSKTILPDKGISESKEVPIDQDRKLKPDSTQRPPEERLVGEYESRTKSNSQSKIVMGGLPIGNKTDNQIQFVKSSGVFYI
jgi:hypothetical protein